MTLSRCHRVETSIDGPSLCIFGDSANHRGQLEKALLPRHNRHAELVGRWLDTTLHRSSPLRVSAHCRADHVVDGDDDETGNAG